VLDIAIVIGRSGKSDSTSLQFYTDGQTYLKITCIKRGLVPTPIPAINPALMCLLCPAATEHALPSAQLHPQLGHCSREWVFLDESAEKETQETRNCLCDEHNTQAVCVRVDRSLTCCWFKCPDNLGIVPVDNSVCADVCTRGEVPDTLNQRRGARSSDTRPKLRRQDALQRGTREGDAENLTGVPEEIGD
jgi:hypothetical protein